MYLEGGFGTRDDIRLDSTVPSWLLLAAGEVVAVPAAPAGWRPLFPLAKRAEVVLDGPGLDAEGPGWP